jgi:hypothetical protein
MLRMFEESLPRKHLLSHKCKRAHTVELVVPLFHEHLCLDCCFFEFLPALKLIGIPFFH